MRNVASAMPKPAASDVFLVRAMKHAGQGGTTQRNAWGSRTCVIVMPKGMPIERAASAWPSGMPLTPERMASVTKEAV